MTKTNSPVVRLFLGENATQPWLGENVEEPFPYFVARLRRRMRGEPFELDAPSGDATEDEVRHFKDARAGKVDGVNPMPYFCAGPLNKKRRRGANLEGLYVVVLDLDKPKSRKKPLPAPAILQLLKNAELIGMVAETSSSRPGAPRARVVVPLAEPLVGMNEKDLKHYGQAAAEALVARIGDTGFKVDGASWVVSQPMYLPLRMPKHVAAGKVPFIGYVSGEPFYLDLSDVPPPSPKRLENSPFVQALKRSALFKGPGNERGKWRIVCPCDDAHGHSTEQDESASQTVYYEAHTNGFASESFDCKDDDCPLKGNPEDGLKALRAELAKEGLWTNTAPALLGMRRGSSIVARPLQYVWKDVLAVGKLTLLAGDPGVGKSQVAAHVIACVTTGKPFPRERESRPPRDVLIFALEDAAEDILKPRLIAAGADLSRCHFVDPTIEERGSARTVNLRQDLPRIEATLAANPKIGLSYVDPVTGALGDNNQDKTGEVRAALQPYSWVLEKYGVAGLAVAHLNKGTGSAKNRVSGSMAFVALARFVYVIGPAPTDSDMRYMVSAKVNLGPDGLGFAFRIKSAEVPSEDPEQPGSIDTSFVEFSAQRVGMHADELLAPSIVQTNDRVREAVAHLRALLGDLLPGEYLETKVADEYMKTNGVRPGDYEHAKRYLGLESRPRARREAWCLMPVRKPE